ncbi:MAG: serine/threonine protein kinase [Archangiaceae bacterium]|nr:serine/threonine protein kinase [Archangiaceae bacterium]
MTGASFIGQKLGDYEVIARVGTGGMGAVFEARHPVIGKRVAVKVLHPAFAADPKVIERFINEARVVNAIGHPAVVDIFSFGKTASGMPYFVMEFLKGRSVFDVLEQEGALPMGRALDLISQLLDVLDKAHAAGVVHRDLKPQNLFVEEGPNGQRLRVLDFGIAKSLTSELKQQLTGSAILGTPGYMAPEQINSEPVTPRTDLYSTGAVLFELLTGRAVYAGTNVGQLLIRALHEEAPRASSVKPDLPKEVDDLVARLLSREASRRPATAREVLELVRGIQQRLEAYGSLPTRAELPALEDPHTTNKELVPVPGVDDKATGVSKAIKPRVDMHEAGQRTEPAFVAPIPVRGSNPRAAPMPVPPMDDATRPVPKVKSNPARPAPNLHEVVAATAVDRQMVERMKVEASAPASGGAGKWLLLLLVLVALAVAGWFFTRPPPEVYVPPADPTTIPGTK